MTRIQHEIDPIERLRRERPDAASDPALIPPTLPLRARTRTAAPRRTRRVALVAALTAAAVLTGVVALGGDRPRSGSALPGIPSAEARQIAVDALEGLTKLDDYDLTVLNTSTEVGGEHRSTEYGTRTVVVGTAVLRSPWMSNSFVGKERSGLDELTVGGRTYEESASSRIAQPWLLDVKDIDAFQRGLMPWDAPPDFRAFVAQLQREQLIDARRDEDGTVVVEVKRPATELAPVTTSGSGPIDPVSGFAQGVVHGPAPDTVVTARVEVGDDGDLRRIRISATYPVVHPDGHGGTEPLETEVVTEYRLRPVRDQLVQAPPAKDVMVVGNAMKARRGATGIAGPQGTLDTFTRAELKALQARARKDWRSAFLRPPRKAPPARHFPNLWAQIRADRQATFAQLRRKYAGSGRDDRSAFQRDPACVPFWPSSGRAMDAAIAKRDPDEAGWRCTLDGDLGTASIEPHRDDWTIEGRAGTFTGFTLD